MYLESLGVKFSYGDESLSPLEEAEIQIQENMQTILNEAYYSKTNEVIAIEKKIGECRKKYKSDQIGFNTSSDRDELEKLFEKAFGFKVCDFTITSSPLFNAATIPIYKEVFNFNDYRKYIISDGKGVKYTKDANAHVVINVTKGLFYSSEFTDEEVTAIILHEVGHNFQTAMNNTCRTLTMIEKVLNIIYFPILWIIAPTTSPFKDKWIDFCRMMRKDYKSLSEAYYFAKDLIIDVLSLVGGVKTAFKRVRRILNPLFGFEGLFYSIKRRIKKDNINLLNIPGRYVGETFADQFVSAYGYSVPLTNALKIMRDYSHNNTVDQVLRSIPLLNAYIDVIYIPDRILNDIFKVHPNDVSRMQSQIKYLEYEVNNNKDLRPATKRELKKQISDLNQTLDKFLAIGDGKFLVNNGIDRIFLLCFGGDWKNFLTQNTPEEFEIAQQRAEEQLRGLKGQ